MQYGDVEDTMEGQSGTGGSRGNLDDGEGGPARDQTLVSRAVRRAQAGDRDAFSFLYARFADDICRYARSIVHDHHEAEDVTQQVFAKLMGVIGKYHERDVPFLAWMLRVTRNVALDHRRRQRPIPVEEVRESDRDTRLRAGPDRVDELTEALSMLPPAQREVLVLRHVAGLTPGEIADLTEKSEGSIHGLHHRGRRALIAELTTRGAAPVTLVPSRGPEST
jgi:RNA polymerase sigma-70 factor (ECF subfamily)